jgi:putative membrane protein
MKAKLLLLVTGLLGLALAVWFIVHEGVGDILAVLVMSGWPLLWLIPLHLLPIAADARGWQALLRPFDPGRRATFGFLTWIASVREAVDRLLPVANVGGQLVGIRLTLLRPIGAAAATASVLVDVLLNIVNQYLFTAIGLGLLLLVIHDTHAADGVAIALVVTMPLPVALYFLLRNGRLFERVKRLAARLLGDTHRLPVAIGESAARLDHTLDTMLRLRKPMVSALAWQLGGMLLSGLETWLALWLLGWPVSIGAAVALESLISAVRNFAFFVPGAIGVQEAGLVLFGAMVGVPADLAVALSLVKRLRDIGFGVPALASWQWAEARQLRHHPGLRHAGSPRV